MTTPLLPSGRTPRECRAHPDCTCIINPAACQVVPEVNSARDQGPSSDHDGHLWPTITAKVLPLPDPNSGMRQRLCLKAIETLPNVTVDCPIATAEPAGYLGRFGRQMTRPAAGARQSLAEACGEPAPRIDPRPHLRDEFDIQSERFVDTDPRTARRALAEPHRRLGAGSA